MRTTRFVAHIKLCIAVLVMTVISSVANAQYITSSVAVGTGMTQYTNGMANDVIFYICNAMQGSLTATPTTGVPNWNFQWKKFNPTTNAFVVYSNQNNLPFATLNNLAPGAYQVNITDASGVLVGTQTVWIVKITTNPSVNVQPIPPGCGSVNLQGTITYGATTSIYNLPIPNVTAPPILIGPQTVITVHFTGTHSYVSDLGFKLVGPAACGSPVIILSLSPAASGGSSCNSGNNYDLTFTTTASNYLNTCSLSSTSTPALSGTYGGYTTGGGVNHLITWSSLYGCDLNSNDWHLQILDVIGADTGTLVTSQVTFSGLDASGQPIGSISHGCTGSSLPIPPDGTTGTASSPPTDCGPQPTPATPIPCTQGYIWTANPPFTIPNATSSLNITLNPGPTVTTTFTLTLTGTCSAAGCGSGTTTDSEVFTYNPPIQAVIDPLAILCDNDLPVNLTCNLTGGTFSGPGITDPALGTFDPAVAGPGIHTITYTPSGVCETGDTQTIEVWDFVDPTITDPGTLCAAGAAIQLTAATPGGTWSGTGITDPTIGTFDPTVSGNGSFTVSYSIPGVCNGNSTIVINVDPNPTLSLTGPTTICDNAAAINLTANVASGVWSGLGITDATLGTFDPTVSGVGMQTLTYSYPGVCNVSETIDVDVLLTVDPTITDPGVLCITDPELTLVAATSGGTWTGTGISNTSAGTFDPATAGAGTFTINYGITHVCNGTSSIQIVVAPVLAPVITAPDEICTGEPAFNITVSIPGGTWTGTGITNATAGTFTAATAGAGNQQVTYSIDNGCLGEVSDFINVIALVDATITEPADMCSVDAPVTLQGANPGGVWAGTGITNTTTGLFDPAVAGPGTHVVAYEINGTCYGFSSVNILVEAQPNPQIVDPGIICSNASTVDLTATANGGTWSGTGITDATNGIFDHNVSGLGTFTITYTISDLCFAQTTIDIEVHAQPIVYAGADVQICDYETTMLGASPGGWDSFSWSNGQTSLTTEVSQQGTYTATATTAGCTATDQVYVEVIEMPTVQLGNDQDICEGTAAVLNAGVIGTWSTGQTAASINVTTTDEYTFVYTTQGCSVTDSVFVEMFEKPVFDLGADISICPGTPVTLSIPYSGQWSTGASGTSITVAATNNYDVSVTNGPCYVTDNIHVNILPLPIINLDDTYEYCQNHFGFLDASNPVNASYLWNTGADSSAIFVYDPGIYWVTVSNVCGSATDQIEVFETDCSYSIYIPNTFTPDGDGKNDVWAPIVYNMSAMEVKVFNRWGEVVYQSNDPEARWTGGVKDGEFFTPDGIYFYELKFTPKETPDAGYRRGYVFLMR